MGSCVSGVAFEIPIEAKELEFSPAFYAANVNRGKTYHRTPGNQQPPIIVFSDPLDYVRSVGVVPDFDFVTVQLLPHLRITNGRHHVRYVFVRSSQMLYLVVPTITLGMKVGNETALDQEIMRPGNGNAGVCYLIPRLV